MVSLLNLLNFFQKQSSFSKTIINIDLQWEISVTWPVPKKMN